MMADGQAAEGGAAGTQGGTAAGAGGAAGGAPAAPWYQGAGADAETVGFWDNKGWSKEVPDKIAIEATKRARQLESHYGVPAEQLLKLPKADAGPEAWRSIHERLGMPKESKDYDFGDAVKDLDETFVTTMREALHKAGVAKDAAAELMKGAAKFFNDTEAAETSAKTLQLQTERSELAKEWGREFEFNRLTAMQGVRRAVGSGEDAQKTLDAMAQTMGYKATMEFWRKIGVATTEATFVDGAQGGGMITTQAGHAARLQELQSDPAWVARLTSGDVAARKEFMNHMTALHGEA
jgi:hypothetical protein